MINNENLEDNKPNQEEPSVQELRKAYAFRLVPTDEQRNLLFRYAQATRYVFNWGLAQIKEVMDKPKKDPEQPTILIQEPLCQKTTLAEEPKKQDRPKIPKYQDQSALLTQIKDTPEGSWLTIAPSQILQQSLKDLESAMKHFFRRIKLKEKPGFPKFKNRRSHDSMRFSVGFKHEAPYVYLTRIGWLKYIDSRPIEGTIRQVTIKRDGKHWYVYVSCLIKRPPIIQKEPENLVSIDLGITTQDDNTFLKVKSSNANVPTSVSSPHFYKRQLGRIETLNQALARKVKGSKNRQKCHEKLQDVYRGMRRKRNDFLHKWSTSFVMMHDVIVVEKLPIKEMMQDETLSQALADVGWHNFVLMLKYKCEWQGKTFFEKEIDKEMADEGN